MPQPDNRSAGALHGRSMAPRATEERSPTSSRSDDVRTDVASRHGFPLDPSSGLPSFDDPDDHVATVLGVGAPSSAEDRHDDASARATPVMPTRERIVVDMPERGLGTYAIITPKRDVAFDPHRDAMLPDEPLTVGAVLAVSLAL